MSSMDDVQPPTVESGMMDGETKESHPAFAVASVGRMHGTSRSLFQSDLEHGETIRLTISSASRYRGLNRDVVHPEQSIVEVEMSLAQWGALVSSAGIGSGVPVTLRDVEGRGRIPGIPFAPRIEQSLSEVNAAVDKVLERARETLEELTDAIEERRGIRTTREALRSHAATIRNASRNTEFAVNSMKHAAENIVSQAKADIESHILDAVRATGKRPGIESPDLHVEPKELKQGTTQDTDTDQ